MPKIPDDIVKRIQDIARIEDVVGDFVTLRKAGVNLTGLCPFHDDKHDGNFIVRPSTITEKRGGNTYRCFVCDKKGGPVTFLMEHGRMTFPDAIRWLGRKYSEPVDDVPLNYTPPPPRPTPPPLPRLTFRRQTVQQSMRGVEQTNLVRWLQQLPWDAEQRARLPQVLHLYCVATSPHGPEWTAFWHITHDGQVLTAKHMKYQTDGHRVKERDAQGNRIFANDWEHAWRARDKQYDPDRWDTTGRALFGIHLIRRYPQAVVNIVESEKTAIIMAAYYGDPDRQLWCACGGLKWLQLDTLQPLIDQGRTVWLWPDRDGKADWQQVADKLGSDKVHVYTGFLDSCWKEEDGAKADVADIAIRMMTTGEGPRVSETKHTGDGQTPTILPHGGSSAPTPDPMKPDGISDEEWAEHIETMQAIHDWKIVHPGDEPFIDPDELSDSFTRWARQRLRDSHTPRDWPPIPTSKIEGIRAVGEILRDNPIIKKLFEHNGNQAERR